MNGRLIFLGDDKMNIFEEVKAAVGINTATEHYGLNVRRTPPSARSTPKKQQV